MHTVDVNSLGIAWLAACRAVLEEGEPGRDGDDPIHELLHLTIQVHAPDPDDPIIARRTAPEMLAWMRANFREQRPVPELGNAPSYGQRLRNQHGRDQVAWVVEKLRARPSSKSATVTTLREDDVSYIPCVSLLDFKLRHDGLLLTCACRSIDVGVKLPANLVELAHLQGEVAGALGCGAGELTLWVASAHIYERDVPQIQELLTGR
jgi:thymidylate synthase